MGRSTVVIQEGDGQQQHSARQSNESNESNRLMRQRSAQKIPLAAIVLNGASAAAGNDEKKQIKTPLTERLAAVSWFDTPTGGPWF